MPLVNAASVPTASASRTQIVVAIPVESADEVDSALAMAAAEIAAGATLVEWRVDSLAEEADGLASVLRLVRECKAPCVVTIRGVAEGGAFRGNEMDRVSLLEAIGTADPAPRFIDFELASLGCSANIRQKILLAVAHPPQPAAKKPQLILSSHDFQGRPSDLTRRAVAMWNDPACAVAKLAWRARSVRDCVEAFELLHQAPKPTIALCMGPFGMASRVLAAKFGAFLTYARAEGDPGTAPGQPTVAQLRKLFRFDSISRTTQVFGIVGWPLDQSLSPLIHNAGFGAIGFDGCYVPFPIPTEWEHFKAGMHALREFRQLDVRGLSVTIPHKEHAVRFIRECGGELDAISDWCGAANTILFRPDGSLKALNTDAPAAVASLAVALALHGDTSASLACGQDPHTVPGGNEMRSAWRNIHVAILGAGGAARAIAAGLALAGARVTLFNRTHARAEAIAHSLHGRALPGGGEAQVTASRMDQFSGETFQAIVHATSVGMEGGSDPEGCMLPPDVALHQKMVVLDTVYRPLQTPLLRMAAEQGATVVDGSDMFIRQAHMQFELFTGHAAPAGLFRRLVDGSLRVR